MFRRIVFVTLGVLEFLAALILFVFAWQMPSPNEVHDGVSRVERVTEETSAQVTRLRRNLHTIREQRPKLAQVGRQSPDANESGDRQPQGPAYRL